MTPAPFDWSAYLTLAANLSINADEASRRSSMSRAYYCVFHAAREHAIRGGHKVKMHLEVWQAFAKDTDQTCKQLGNMGLRMKLVRENADYKSQFARQEEQMNKQLVEARRLLQILTTLPPHLPIP